MDPHERLITAAIAYAVLAHTSACAPIEGDLAFDDQGGWPSDLGEEDAAADKGLASSNGLKGINGLTAENGLVTTNGLKLSNGLSTTNGLTTVNGVTTMNGLATRSGRQTYDGKFVNCYNQPDSRCISPDGILSRTKGLMKDADGVVTAQYLVRCALPPNRAIRIQDYAGTFVTLQGEIGVAPEWSTSSCSQECEEKVTACMLAFINQDGFHRSIMMTAAWPANPIGTAHPGYNVLESVFFGNIFKSPVEAYVVSGYDHAATVSAAERGTVKSDYGLALRSCNHAGRNARTVEQFLNAMPYCSVTHIGAAAPKVDVWSALQSDTTKCGKCSFAATDAGWGGVPSRSTALQCSGPGTDWRSWRFPVSTWRDVNPWLPD